MKMHLLPCFVASVIYLFANGLHSCNRSAEPAHGTIAPHTASDSAIVGPGKPVYYLDKPALSIQLDDPSLVEISGLSPTDQPGVLMAIADEAGEVFFMKADNGSLTRRVLFRDRGDFEGIEYVNGIIYALKSDGLLFEIKNWDKGLPDISFYETGLDKTNDVEGLCFDPARNALLLACKEDPETNVARKIFAFDLSSKQLGQVPVYTIIPEEVDRLMPLGPEDKKHAFSPSAIAVHPFRKEIYVLSTALKRMLVLDSASGRILLVYRIDKKIIPQPEGIAFDAQGNLFIASEGKNSKGMLLRFDFKGPAQSRHPRQ